MNASEILAILDMLRNLTLEEASARHHIRSVEILAVAEELSSRSLLKVVGEMLEASLKQKFGIVYLALRRGASLRKISESLSWRDFEEFAAEIFTYHGYDVETHVVLRRPRMEVDIEARKDKTMILADCKHWSKPLHDSTLKKIVEAQIDRSFHLLEKRGGSGDKAYPIVITLQSLGKPLFKGVPIVPINQLNNFLLEFPGFIHEIFHVE
ncbi:MAG: restriction endonuclease [Candidatus Geothermarchaeales archaeon]